VSRPNWPRIHLNWAALGRGLRRAAGRVASSLAPLGLAVAASGCFGTPTPLAPAIRGSVGVPHHGVLTDGAVLPQRGEGYQLFRKNGVRWGNSRLVAAIKHAAREVARARPGSPPLIVGDLSAQFGGSASGHRSHRTGRDADLLIFVLTPDGRPVPSPGFVEIGPDGLASNEDGDFFRIDIDREWLLIKALLTAPDASVQWLFVARWLEALLIEHARARGEDPELIWHAETVLLQPRDSADHDDHLHLRVACTPEEAVRGCLGGGPYWPWLPSLPKLSSPSDAELTAALIGDLLPGANADAGAEATAATP
jgi:penicillin-insensitive murein DD-endopeptidase